MALRISVRVTVPKEILNIPAVQQEIASTQREKTAPQLRRLFGQTVEGWGNKPRWDTKQTITSDQISIAVWAAGENADQYQIVNFGVGHYYPIVPKRPGGMLIFQEGYRASTRPRVLSSRPYQRFGRIRRAMSVMHPPIEPRAFDETIADEISEDFSTDMQDAIARGSHQGH